MSAPGRARSQADLRPQQPLSRLQPLVRVRCQPAAVSQPHPPPATRFLRPSESGEKELNSRHNLFSLIQQSTGLWPEIRTCDPGELRCHQQVSVTVK